MRVLLVEPWGKRPGHPSTYPGFLGNALVGCKFDTTLVTFDGLLGWDEELKVKQLSLLEKSGGLASLLRFFVNKYRHHPPFQYLVAIMESFSCLFLARMLSEKHDTVIHVLDSDPYSRLFLTIMKNWNIVVNLPYSFSVAEDFRSELRAKVIRYGFEKSVKRNRVSFVCDTFEAGESYSRHMPEIFRKRLICIPWGVGEPKRIAKSEARKKLNLPHDGDIFLTFGTTHPGKCFKTIFQAFHDLPEKVFLLHAGKITGDKDNDPRWLAEKYNCLRRTIIVDQTIPTREMINYFSAADAIILSYKKDFLTSSGVLSHACQFLLPVIASDVGQVGEFVKTYKLGLTFVPENPDSLREVMVSFLNLSKKERVRLRKNLKTFATIFSWREIAKRYGQIYKSLIP
jgi:glycosyltransferase involved in cell wall biosynthesis